VKGRSGSPRRVWRGRGPDRSIPTRRRKPWAFAVGVVVYLLDALVYMKFAAWLPVVIHAVALYYIGTAFMSLRIST